MATKKNAELWDRLENESPSAYRAFECFLHSTERQIPAAYRSYSGNPDAKGANMPDYFTRWSRNFAWRDRALTYDHYIAEIRRTGAEKAIRKEAERQMLAVEQTRNRMNELLAASYQRAIDWLNSEDFQRADMTARDVIQIIKLHIESTKNDSDAEQRGVTTEEEWTEEEDAEEFVDRVVESVNAEPTPEAAELDAFWEAQEGPS